MGLDTKTFWLTTVSRNVTLTLLLVSCGTFASLLKEDTLRIRYQEKASENELRNVCMCCSEKTSIKISDSVIISCIYQL
jgi:hypothetical protein